MNYPNYSEVNVKYVYARCEAQHPDLPSTIWNTKKVRKLIRILLAEKNTTIMSSLLYQSIQPDLPSSATPATTL